MSPTTQRKVFSTVIGIALAILVGVAFDLNGVQRFAVGLLVLMFTDVWCWAISK